MEEVSFASIYTFIPTFLYFLKVCNFRFLLGADYNIYLAPSLIETISNIFNICLLFIVMRETWFLILYLSFNSLRVHLTKPGILFTREAQLIGCLKPRHICFWLKMTIELCWLSALLILMLFPINFVVCLCFVYSSSHCPLLVAIIRYMVLRCGHSMSSVNRLMICRDLVCHERQQRN